MKKATVFSLFAAMLMVNPLFAAEECADACGGHGHAAVVTGYNEKGVPLISTTHLNGGQPTIVPLELVNATPVAVLQHH